MKRQLAACFTAAATLFGILTASAANAQQQPPSPQQQVRPGAIDTTRASSEIGVKEREFAHGFIDGAAAFGLNLANFGRDKLGAALQSGDQRLKTPDFVRNGQLYRLGAQKGGDCVNAAMKKGNYADQKAPYVAQACIKVKLDEMAKNGNPMSPNGAPLAPQIQQGPKTGQPMNIGPQIPAKRP